MLLLLSDSIVQVVAAAPSGVVGRNTRHGCGFVEAVGSERANASGDDEVVRNGWD
jgi:hypothetical protein